MSVCTRKGFFYKNLQKKQHVASLKHLYTGAGIFMINNHKMINNAYLRNYIIKLHLSYICISNFNFIFHILVTCIVLFDR